jgi:hypothetical protein
MARNDDIRSAWDLPAATGKGKAHDEWLIDESLAETFPASDATSPSRPGSLLGSRYATGRNERVRYFIDTPGPWVAALGLVAFFWLMLKRRGRR